MVLGRSGKVMLLFLSHIVLFKAHKKPLIATVKR
jgi:hypothetical protein